MSHKQIVKEVVNAIKNFKGVHQVIVLKEEDKKKVLELEMSVEQKVLMGLGRGDNQGVKISLEREITIAFVTDIDYAWPPGPNVILVCNGNVVGYEVSDPKTLEELKKRKDALLMGNFVMFKDMVSKHLHATKEPPFVIFPVKSCPDVEKISKVHEVVQGSPSPPICDYLMRKMKANFKDKQLGIALLGFNIK